MLPIFSVIMRVDAKKEVVFGGTYQRVETPETPVFTVMGSDIE